MTEIDAQALKNIVESKCVSGSLLKSYDHLPFPPFLMVSVCHRDDPLKAIGDINEIAKKLGTDLERGLTSENVEKNRKKFLSFVLFNRFPPLLLILFYFILFDWWMEIDE